MSRIYYIEDDADIRNLVVYTLNMTGFEAHGFESAAAFLPALEASKPDLILLDVMLPGESGFDILRLLKGSRETAAIPVVMITALGDENNKVNGLEAGADDYISKPFGVMELIARVKAVLRRCSCNDDIRLLTAGPLRMNTAQHILQINEIPVQLTLKEFELLRMLMENIGKLVDRETMIRQIWGPGSIDANHTLDAHMRTLRLKMGELGACIQTVYGRGYRLRIPE